MVINWTKVYDMLGVCRNTNALHSAKRRSFCVTLASITSGYEYSNPSFNNAMSFLKENITTI